MTDGGGDQVVSGAPLPSFPLPLHSPLAQRSIIIFSTCFISSSCVSFFSCFFISEASLRIVSLVREGIEVRGNRKQPYKCSHGSSW